MKFSMVIFIVVMAGTLGVIAVGSLISGTSSSLTSPEMLSTLGMAGGVISLVVLISLLSSRKYLSAARGRAIQKAVGEAQHGKIRAEAAHFEVRIGRTKIRLTPPDLLEAFQVGTAYRVYFLPGPVPAILSGEVIGTESEADRIEPERAIEDDVILQRHQRMRPVVIVLALLSLGIPLAGFLASSLPVNLRCGVIGGFLAVAVFFVYWALLRTSD